MSVIKLIGSNPNQVSRNKDLGSLAFQSSDNAIIESGRIDVKGGGSNLLLWSEQVGNAYWLKWLLLLQKILLLRLMAQLPQIHLFQLLLQPRISLIAPRVVWSELIHFQFMQNQRVILIFNYCGVRVLITPISF